MFSQFYSLLHTTCYYNAWKTPIDCKDKTGLDNPMVFPSLDYLNQFLRYDHTKPKHHFAIFVELEKLVERNSYRDVWSARDRNSEEILLYIYKDFNEAEKPKTFSFSNFKAGKTVAILYPETLERNKIIICFVNYNTCCVFDSSLKNVLSEAEKMFKASKCINDELNECFSCGKVVKTLTCARCKMTNYCSKECQLTGWNECHKGLCRPAVFLSRLTELPSCKFEDYLSFNIAVDKEEQSLYGLPLPQSKYEIFKGGKLGPARVKAEEQDDEKENSGTEKKHIGKKVEFGTNHGLDTIQRVTNYVGKL